MKSIKIMSALIFALILIFFNREISHIIKKYLKEEDLRPVLGVLQSYKGSVYIKESKSLSYNKIEKNFKIKHFDKLITSKNSKATLHIFPNFQLEILENSNLIFEKKQNFSLITFYEGEFKILSSGSSGRLMVSKSGKIQNIQPKSPIVEKSKQININLQKKNNKSKMSLSNEYIKKILKTREPLLKKCSTKSLKVNPIEKWQVHLNFTIRPNGHTSSVRFIKGTIADLKLQQCIMDVVERTVFKAFKGHPIIINYPISLNYLKSLK